jgi:hypothetical protein
MQPLNHKGFFSINLDQWMSEAFEQKNMTAIKKNIRSLSGSVDAGAN